MRTSSVSASTTTGPANSCWRSRRAAIRPSRRCRRGSSSTAAAGAIASLACEGLTLMIARPIRELVDGARRIAAGQFDAPVRIHRRDELGLLADSFNQMSQGLKERDGLLEERVKTQRDLALA